MHLKVCDCVIARPNKQTSQHVSGGVEMFTCNAAGETTLQRLQDDPTVSYPLLPLVCLRSNLQAVGHPGEGGGHGASCKADRRHVKRDMMHVKQQWD